ncbi:hypothetical protein [Martelella radicis]|uniref:Uncharacterized protein n=1 Tax=Martelella radicis TaxID=1397476 RepID=A0A7W6KK11_9HYPH|nr:hypothetical protein [Martelella radicis]MBB4122445.1 hypothetical protein [Martelella radicis]
MLMISSAESCSIGNRFAAGSDAPDIASMFPDNGQPFLAPQGKRMVKCAFWRRSPWLG